MLPKTEYESQTVMLCAERADVVKIENGPIDKAQVARRADTFYGPDLLLDAAGELWKLTCPDRLSQLVLWEDDMDLETGQQFHVWGEVTAELIEGDKYNICRDCGEPIKNAQHERLALLGISHSESDSKGVGSDE